MEGKSFSHSSLEHPTVDISATTQDPDVNCKKHLKTECCSSHLYEIPYEIHEEILTGDWFRDVQLSPTV